MNPSTDENPLTEEQIRYKMIEMAAGPRSTKDSLELYWGNKKLSKAEKEMKKRIRKVMFKHPFADIRWLLTRYP